MRILLMLPYDISYSRETPDLGLGYLASCLEREGHHVQLCLKLKDLNSRQALSDIISNGKFDVVGIKVMSCSVMRVNATVEIIRDINPNTKIILGGPHVSGDPQSTFRLVPGSDYAFHGESEIGLVKLVRAFSKGILLDDIESAKIPNLVWRKGDKTVVNAMERVSDLDELPFPAWELMSPETFSNTPFGGHSRRFPIAPITLTRGCPNSCTFCEAGIINGHRIRARSIDNIMAEIMLLKTKFGVKEIQFFDSNCAHRNGPLRELCRRIISEKVDITWSAPNGIRIDSIDRELVDLMKRSGCFHLSVGIESGAPRILKKIRKCLPLDVVKEKISLFREVGIGVTGLFMIGFPGETAEEINQTISFALELPLTGCGLSIFCPLPGTDLCRELYGDRSLEVEMLQSLDFRSYKNNLTEVPYEDLRKIQMNTYRHFYFRPRVIRYFLKNLNSISKIRFVINNFFEYAFKKTWIKDGSASAAQ